MTKNTLLILAALLLVLFTATMCSAPDEPSVPEEPENGRKVVIEPPVDY